ncbi:TIGR03619 family F420-dependent LLM class oxidoreductase [Streptomyces sp. NBC_01022]|uniref:TIGR03619 family F420-dependent LLM class oxidoreductase n=1 Tax=Streptomyces sp. NBC_01022 TaxID=2903723 RepID=UPI002DDBD639|nr:TIGR03619 family F420-dependent LLM class oxidoreductase [Streptomyces sp. NBC_01022]WRZ82589.1 TIGR03619 family F420-dependent LLM class oxidoreductase [Streptomyces sp. NBC_01022]
MKFTIAMAMIPLDQLVPLAKTAEECGFSAVALPDSVFFSERAAAEYPYTSDGRRMWNEETPFADPLIAAAAMGAVTESLVFRTNVLKLGSRNPLLLARQVGTVANLTRGRFELGVGVGWAPEEFEWCGVPYRRRGARVDEMIEVIRLVLGGGMVEYHGDFYDFDRLRMSPAPQREVPIVVGGHSEAALRRAARIGNGWTSALMPFDELVTTVARLHELRAEFGTADRPFDIQASGADRQGADGYAQLEATGVTNATVMPWAMKGLAMDCPVEAKQDALREFAAEYMG